MLALLLNKCFVLYDRRNLLLTMEPVALRYSDELSVVVSRDSCFQLILLGANLHSRVICKNRVEDLLLPEFCSNIVFFFGFLLSKLEFVGLFKQLTLRKIIFLFVLVRLPVKCFFCRASSEFSFRLERLLSEF